MKEQTKMFKCECGYEIKYFGDAVISKDETRCTRCKKKITKCEG
jgi:hypothetical protein